MDLLVLLNKEDLDGLKKRISFSGMNSVFGLSFMWSDLLCYAVGTLFAWRNGILIDGYTRRVSVF